MEKSERKRIYDNYRKDYGEYVDPTFMEKKYKDGRPGVSPSKIGGNIFAYYIKSELDKILDGKDYHVSVNNSYIDGCFTEWDLLICKGKGSKDEYNIYKPNDVLCTIELKSGGLVGYGTDKSKDNYIGKYFEKAEDSLKKYLNSIKYIYVSLNESDTKKKVIDAETDKRGFYSYYVTTGSWSYKNFKSGFKEAAKLDDNSKSLKEIVTEIIKKVEK